MRERDRDSAGALVRDYALGEGGLGWAELWRNHVQDRWHEARRAPTSTVKSHVH